MIKKITLAIAGLLLFTAIAMTTAHFVSNHEKPNSPPVTSPAAALFEANLPDKNGHMQSLQQWQGKIIVLNFWATWCEPCREEMPELSALYSAYQDNNLTVIGIALDEVEAIKAFGQENNIDYPLLSAEESGAAISAQLGNNKSALPYTVIIKPDGSIAKTYFGRVDKALLDETLIKLF